MSNAAKPGKRISAEGIARLADQGKDVSKFFAGGKMVRPGREQIQRANRARQRAQ